MSAAPESGRHNPFEDEDLRSDIAAFRPREASEARERPDADELAQIAAARGFDDRGPAPAIPVKEPTKPLQFRLPESEVDAFHQAAYEEFGPKHGAKTALFLKLWRSYQESKMDHS